MSRSKMSRLLFQEKSRENSLPSAAGTWSLWQLFAANLWLFNFFGSFQVATASRNPHPLRVHDKQNNGARHLIQKYAPGNKKQNKEQNQKQQSRTKCTYSNQPDSLCAPRENAPQSSPGCRTRGAWACPSSRCPRSPPACPWSCLAGNSWSAALQRKYSFCK